MTRRPGNSPWRARVWRDNESGGAYVIEPVQADGPPDTQAPQPDGDYPVGANAGAVLAWVGANADRAEVARAQEMARPTARQTVLGPVERLLRAEGRL
jgi:hypothetical protein